MTRLEPLDPVKLINPEERMKSMPLIIGAMAVRAGLLQGCAALADGGVAAGEGASPFRENWPSHPF